MSATLISDGQPVVIGIEKCQIKNSSVDPQVMTDSTVPIPAVCL